MESPNFKEELEPESDGPALFEQLIMNRFGEKGIEVYRLINGKMTAEAIMERAGVDEDFIINLFEFLENRGIIRMERPRCNVRPEGPKCEKQHPLTEDEYSALKSIYGGAIMGIPRDEIERNYETLTGIDVEDGLLLIRKMKGERLTGDELSYIEQVRKAAEARGHGWGTEELVMLYLKNNVGAETLDDIYNIGVQKFEDRDSALRMVHAYLLMDGKRTHREIMDVSGITLSELWFLQGYCHSRGYLVNSK